jgi:hypothetical protein
MVWTLCLVAFFALGMLGRPGVLRVYIPVLSLLIIAPFFIKGSWLRTQNTILRRLVQGMIFIVAISNTTTVFSKSKAAQINAEKDRCNFYNFPNNPIVVWGSAFPFENIYPVLKQPDGVLKYKLYGLGVFTLAPFSRAYFEQKNGRGFLDLLLSKTGVPLMENKQSLNIYCKEHFQGILKELAIHQYGHVRVTQLRCESETDQ